MFIKRRGGMKGIAWNSLFALPTLMVCFQHSLRPECLPQTIKQVIDELLVFLGCKINYTQSENINMQYEWCVLADSFAFLSASNWFSLLSHKHVTILFNCQQRVFFANGAKYKNSILLHNHILFMRL